MCVEFRPSLQNAASSQDHTLVTVRATRATELQPQVGRSVGCEKQGPSRTPRGRQGPAGTRGLGQAALLTAASRPPAASPSLGSGAGVWAQILAPLPHLLCVGRHPRKPLASFGKRNSRTLLQKSLGTQCAVSGTCASRGLRCPEYPASVRVPRLVPALVALLTGGPDSVSSDWVLEDTGLLGGPPKLGA